MPAFLQLMLQYAISITLLPADTLRCRYAIITPCHDADAATLIIADTAYDDDAAEIHTPLPCH